MHWRQGGGHSEESGASGVRCGKIGDAALWTEAHFSYKAPVTNLMSDPLYDDLKAAGMSIWAPECYFCVV